MLIFSILIVSIILIVILIVIGKQFENRKAIDKNDKQIQPPEVISGAESAVIAMALHLYYADIHDEESNIITLKNIPNRYSPWSSKIYGIQ